MSVAQAAPWVRPYEVPFGSGLFQRQQDHGQAHAERGRPGYRADLIANDLITNEHHDEKLPAAPDNEPARPSLPRRQSDQGSPATPGCRYRCEAAPHQSESGF